MRIKAVLWDFDGVIAATPPLNFEAWRQVFAEAGVRISAQTYYRLEGLGPLRVSEALCVLHHLPAGDAPRLAGAKEQRMRAIPQAPLYPEIPGLLEGLRHRGVASALVTGASRERIEHSLPALVRDHMQTIVTSSEVTHTKPHPEPYLTALAALAADPGTAVVVENAPLGIASAQAAGLRCVAVTTTLPASELAGAKPVFRDHRELSDWLLAGATAEAGGD